MCGLAVPPATCLPARTDNKLANWSPFGHSTDCCWACRSVVCRHATRTDRRSIAYKSSSVMRPKHAPRHGLTHPRMSDAMRQDRPTEASSPVYCTTSASSPVYCTTSASSPVYCTTSASSLLRSERCLSTHGPTCATSALSASLNHSILPHTLTRTSPSLPRSLTRSHPLTHPLTRSLSLAHRLWQSRTRRKGVEVQLPPDARIQVMHTLWQSAHTLAITHTLAVHTLWQCTHSGCANPAAVSSVRPYLCSSTDGCLSLP